MKGTPILIPLTGEVFKTDGRKDVPFIEAGLASYQLTDIPELRFGISPDVSLAAIRLDTDGAHASFNICGFPHGAFCLSPNELAGLNLLVLEGHINRVRGTVLTDKGEGFAVKAEFKIKGHIECQSTLTNVQIELTSLRHEDGEDFFIPVSDFRKSYALSVFPLYPHVQAHLSSSHS